MFYCMYCAAYWRNKERIIVCVHKLFTGNQSVPVLECEQKYHATNYSLVSAIFGSTDVWLKLQKRR